MYMTQVNQDSKTFQFTQASDELNFNIFDKLAFNVSHFEEKSLQLRRWMYSK